jgi:hypothetical protein
MAVFKGVYYGGQRLVSYEDNEETSKEWITEVALALKHKG